MNQEHARYEARSAIVPAAAARAQLGAQLRDARYPVAILCRRPALPEFARGAARRDIIIGSALRTAEMVVVVTSDGARAVNAASSPVIGIRA